MKIEILNKDYSVKLYDIDDKDMELFFSCFSGT